MGIGHVRIPLPPSPFNEWLSSNTITTGRIRCATLASIARCNLRGAIRVDNIAPSNDFIHPIPFRCAVIMSSIAVAPQIASLWAVVYIVDDDVYEALLP